MWALTAISSLVSAYFTGGESTEPGLVSQQKEPCISELYIYPVKSCSPIKVDKAEITSTGFKWDRHWVIVDTNNKMITQRTKPEMALIKVSIEEDSGHLRLSADRLEDLLVPLIQPKDESAVHVQTSIWKDTVNGLDCGDKAAAWLESFLGQQTRLIARDSEFIRHVTKYTPPASEGIVPETVFADGFPLLITTTASIDDVNKHLESPIEIIRFRPNIIVTNTDSYAEETWKRISISKPDSSDSKETKIWISCRCDRCTIPDVDPNTGIMGKGVVAKSLRKFRCVDPGKPTKICFAMNAIPLNTGNVISVGDTVNVTETGEHRLIPKTSQA